MRTRTDASGGGRHGARNLPNREAPTRDLPVWDPLVRIIHWGLAAAIVLNGFITKHGSEIHQWVGYAAVGLVVLRLVWGLVGTRTARFTSFPPSPRRALRHVREIARGERTVHLSHNPLGALMVYNLWATVAALGVTGYMMGTRQYFGVEWVEDIHGLAYDWLLVSIALHLGGVVFDAWRSRVPLVRAMVTGRKRVPEGMKVK